MISSLDRGVVTDAVLAALATAGIAVGDVKAPDSAGWQDQPGGDASVFIPYVVVTPMNATNSSGPMVDPQTEWRLPYTLTTYGVTRDQIEDLADFARRTLGAVSKRELTMRDTTTVWKWLQSTTTSIGGIGFTEQVKPTAYSQSDSVLVWLSKKL